MWRQPLARSGSSQGRLTSEKDTQVAHPALVRVLTQDRTRALERERALALDRALALHENSAFWKLIQENADLHSSLLDTLCDLLNLTPRAQWWEALRLCGLPQVPGRITLTDPQVWQHTEEAFVQNRAGETDCLHAASQLLFDVWLWLFGGHDDPGQSPFPTLAQLTRHIDSPPLRVAHCIRDLAYGDESRAAELVALVRSEDPAYRTLFEEAFWRDPQDPQQRAPQRKQRRRS